MAASDVSLGIDLGTSKIAIVALEAGSANPLATVTRKTEAHMTCAEAQRFEQSPSRIFEALEQGLAAIPKDLRTRVCAIGVTGQMHGVVLWNGKSFSDPSLRFDRLITWQDGRCLEGGFLTGLQRRCADQGLRSGYGAATLAWLAEHEPDTLKKFSRAATIHDCLVNLLVGGGEVLADPTDAHSWGLFDCAASMWEEQKLAASGVPLSFFPRVVPSGTVAGSLAADAAQRWHVPQGVPVVTALGDNQASLYATITDPAEELALTLGTGGQLSTVLSEHPRSLPVGAPYEIRPYPGGRFIAVAASLCGGQALSWLPDTIISWCEDLKISPPAKEEIFSRLDALALSAFDSPLRMSSSFLGERHDPEKRGAVEGIDLANFTLGHAAAALAKSVVTNLHDMLPRAFWDQKMRIVGSGNGIRKLRSVRRAIEEIFSMPLVVLEEREEAATGAALFALDSVRR